jgi:hypothetical protein
MSLIQDALKRKTEESVPNQPPAAPADQTPSETPVPVKSPKPYQAVLLILLVTLLLAVPIGYSLYLMKPKPRPVPATVAEKTVSAPEAPAPEPEAMPVPPPAPHVQITKPPVEPAPEETTAQETKLTWPELKLTGIASSGNQRIAILNGKMLCVGRQAGEVIVREVRETEVVVELHGEQRILHVDE